MYPNKIEIWKYTGLAFESIGSVDDGGYEEKGAIKKLPERTSPTSVYFEDKLFFVFNMIDIGYQPYFMAIDRSGAIRDPLTDEIIDPDYGPSECLIPYSSVATPRLVAHSGKLHMLFFTSFTFMDKGTKYGVGFYTWDTKQKKFSGVGGQVTGPGSMSGAITLDFGPTWLERVADIDEKLSPPAAVSFKGSLYIFWNYEDNGKYPVRYSARSGDTAPSSPETWTSSPVPNVSAPPDRMIAATVYQDKLTLVYRDDKKLLRMTQSSDGKTWTDPVRLSSILSSGSPIAVDSGAAVAVNQKNDVLQLVYTLEAGAPSATDTNATRVWSPAREHVLGHGLKRTTPGLATDPSTNTLYMVSRGN